MLRAVRGLAYLVKRQFPRVVSVWVTVSTGRGAQCVLTFVLVVRHLILICWSAQPHSS
jgi:hypothetical protein